MRAYRANEHMAANTIEDRITVDDLVALFVGDEDSYGYAHPALATAICERLAPRDFEQFRGKLYPNVATSALDDDLQKILRVGYFRWKKQARAVKV